MFLVGDPYKPSFATVTGGEKKPKVESTSLFKTQVFVFDKESGSNFEATLKVPTGR